MELETILESVYERSGPISGSYIDIRSSSYNYLKRFLKRDYFVGYFPKNNNTLPHLKQDSNKIVDDALKNMFTPPYQNNNTLPHLKQDSNKIVDDALKNMFNSGTSKKQRINYIKRNIGLHS